MRLPFLTFSLIGLFGCSSEPELNTAPHCPLIVQKPVAIQGLKTSIGTVDGYPEEKPRQVELEDFDIDNTEVTNAQFRKFVEATEYVTTAERPQPGFNQSGGAVFMPPTSSNPSWWHFIEGANWKHPEGPDSTIEGRENEPVVQVSLIDAQNYAEWAGRALPTEAQWEIAARGHSETAYIWGTERAPDGIEQANTWQGVFPIKNLETDGFARRAPMGCYAPNDFGLYDMIGNVWEWTVTEYSQTRTSNSFAIKGGSFLCAPNYCARYRAPARQSQEADFSTNHIGFRTVSRPETE